MCICSSVTPTNPTLCYESSVLYYTAVIHSFLLLYISVLYAYISFIYSFSYLWTSELFPGFFNPQLLAMPL